MKKLFITIALVSICLMSVQAQWTNNPDGSIWRGGNVGFGGASSFIPERPIHLRANNSIMRIDRNSADPGLIIARFSTNWSQVYKSFYFYTKATNPNDGKFVIADWGANVSGPDHTARLVIQDNGNVGIGNYIATNIPEKLTVAGNTKVNGSLTANDVITWGPNGSKLNTRQGANIELRGIGGTPFIDFIRDASIPDFNMRLILTSDDELAVQGGKLRIDGDLRVTGNISSSGTINMTGSNVYIGVTPPPTLSGPFKLFVEGGIRSEKVKVDLRSAWADYVFEENYDLRSLTEVEAFIQENNHLPDVPSAAEVEENGIDVAEMDATLLRKIEELTLYVIELQKQNKALQERIVNLEKK